MKTRKKLEDINEDDFSPTILSGEICRHSEDGMTRYSNVTVMVKEWSEF